MRLAEAIELIRPALRAEDRAWADLGAGTGIFTLALAALLPPDALVVAVDTDRHALGELRRTTAERSTGPRVEVRRADFRDVAAAMPAGCSLDGALFANALHFDPHPAAALRGYAALLHPGGRLLVIEYDGRAANPWVPHPIARARLPEVADEAGVSFAGVVGERPSAYGGTLYAALLEP